jgi:hypothetical protein
VAMLTRMIERGNQVREGDTVYGYVNENGNEGDSGAHQRAQVTARKLAEPDPRRWEQR